jgi:hypothetical protein
MVLITETEQPLQVEVCSQIMGYSCIASCKARASLGRKLTDTGAAAAHFKNSLRDMEFLTDIDISFPLK